MGSIDDDDDWSSELKQALPEGKRPAIERALLEGLVPVKPPADALPELLAEVRKTDRLSHFAPALSELYDLSLKDAHALIAQIRGSEGWEDGPAPGVKMLPVHAGPRVRDGLAAIVRLDSDAEFPEHPHLGTERVLVIEGAYLDSSGAQYWRGDLHESAGGSKHSFKAVGGKPCLCAALHAVSQQES